MKEEKREPLPLLQTGAGTIISSMAISGFILGYGTDYLVDTTPLFMLGFGLLGLIGGIMKAHKLMISTPGVSNIEESDKRSREE